MKSLTSRSIKVFLVTCTPKHYISALKFCCRRRRCCCFNSGRHHRYHRPVVKIQLKTNRITIWKKNLIAAAVVGLPTVVVDVVVVAVAAVFQSVLVKCIGIPHCITAGQVNT